MTKFSNIFLLTIFSLLFFITLIILINLFNISSIIILLIIYSLLIFINLSIWSENYIYSIISFLTLIRGLLIIFLYFTRLISNIKNNFYIKPILITTFLINTLFLYKLFIKYLNLFHQFLFILYYNSFPKLIYIYFNNLFHLNTHSCIFTLLRLFPTIYLWKWRAICTYFI